jgi:tRNA pseudouridine38-40 synthase
LNIRLDIEYDGEEFHGWQRQLGVPTVQATIEDIISEIVGEKTILFGASRTDSGVHARNQVGNFFAQSPIPAQRWCLALNTKLPREIRILRSQEVPEDFHAQRSATSKEYEYRVLNRSFSSALDRRVYFWPHPLSWDKMLKGLNAFVGQKDFAAFQSGKPTVKTTVRTVYRFSAVQDPAVEGLWKFNIEGNGFLRQMVRNIMGTVMEIGQNLREPEEIEEIFSSGEREFAGRAAPARGLFLVKVNYGLVGPTD